MTAPVDLDEKLTALTGKFLGWHLQKISVDEDAFVAKSRAGCRSLSQRTTSGLAQVGRDGGAMGS